jgi:hypothetical protein
VCVCVHDSAGLELQCVFGGENVPPVPRAGAILHGHRIACFLLVAEQKLLLGRAVLKLAWCGREGSQAGRPGTLFLWSCT